MKNISLLILISILICSLVGCNKNSENKFEDLSENKGVSQQGNSDIENEEITNISGEVISIDKEIAVDTETSGKYNWILKDYVFEDSDKKIIGYDKLHRNELCKYSKDELEIGKNEIFARYGYDFDSESLERYFLSKSWYEKIDGKKITFAELNTYEQENVKAIDEYIKLLKEVENCKDINTVMVPDLVVDETLINAEILIDTDETVYVDVWEDTSKKYVKFSDDYVLDEKWDENLHHKYFENQKELLPKKIYLMNENANCYYEYNGQIYYIPVEKCETPEEERIEYREHDLVVYKKNDIAKIWNLEIQMYEKYDFDDDEYFESMNLLYISDLKYKNIDKVYEIDLDGDINTIELSIPCYYLDPGDGIELTSLVAMKDGDKTSIVSGVDYFLCGNIGNYRNVFYSNGFSRGLPFNMFIEECYLVKYYIYDKEEGFITVNRLANGDKWNENIEKMNSYQLTLSEDITFYKANNELRGEEYAYTTWPSLDGETLERVLPKGTKVRLVTILDWATNSIIETEDGIRYKIVSYAGM